MRHFLLRIPHFNLKVLDHLFAARNKKEMEQIADDFLQNPNVRLALFFNGPRMLEKYEDYKKTGSNNGIVDAIYKILIRMSGRLTPNGALAGVTLGGWEDKTTIQLKPFCTKQLSYRLDGDILDFLCRKHSHQWVKSKKFQINPTLMERQCHLEFVDFEATFKGGGIVFSKVRSNPNLKKLLRMTKNPCDFKDLKKNFDIKTKKDTDGLGRSLSGLVEKQVLITQAVASPIGDLRFQNQLSSLDTISNLQISDEAQKKIQSSLEKLSLSSLSAAHGFLKKYFQTHNGSLTHSPFRCEWIREGHVNLDKTLKEEAQTAANVLFDAFSSHLLMGSIDYRMTLFRQRFVAEYSDRHIPLLSVFQNDSLFLEFFRPNFKFDVNFSELRAFQQKLIEQNTASTIELTDDLLSQLKAIDKKLNVFVKKPKGWNILAELGRSELGREKIFIKNIFGGPAGRMLMRHAEFFPQLEEELLRELHRLQAQEPGVQYVDLGFLPIGPVPNYMRRCRWTDHFIPINVIGEERDINYRLSDLLICVREDEVQLSCARTGKRLKPLATYPYSFSADANTIYAFLAMLGTQNQPQTIQWVWATSIGRRPRVERGGIILSPAQWEFDRDVFLRCLTDKNFLAAHQLPDWVVFCEGDRRLPLKLSNPFVARAVLTSGTQTEKILIEEFFFSQHTPLARDGHDATCTEIIFPSPVGDTPAIPVQSERIPKNKFIKSQGNFRNWIVTSPSSYRLKSIFDAQISPWIQKMMQLKVIKNFYYVFMGAETELRLRLWLNDGKEIEWPDFFVHYLELGEIKFMETPFEIEMATYKKRSLLDSYWKLSCLDSRAFCDFRLEGVDPSAGRLLLPVDRDIFFLICGMDHYFDLANIALTERKKMLGLARRELKAHKEVARWIRDQRPFLKAIGGKNSIGEWQKSLSPWLKDCKKRRDILLSHTKNDRLLLVKRMIHMNNFRVIEGSRAGFETAMARILVRAYETSIRKD